MAFHAPLTPGGIHVRSVTFARSRKTVPVEGKKILAFLALGRTDSRKTCQPSIVAMARPRAVVSNAHAYQAHAAYTERHEIRDTRA